MCDRLSQPRVAPGNAGVWLWPWHFLQECGRRLWATDSPGWTGVKAGHLVLDNLPRGGLSAAKESSQAAWGEVSTPPLPRLKSDFDADFFGYAEG